MLYVGVDAHLTTSFIAVMNERGRVVKTAQVSNTRASLGSALGRYRQPLKATLEAGYRWGPTNDWLDELADEVVLAHPVKVRAIAEARIKPDKIDSGTIAHPFVSCQLL